MVVRFSLLCAGVFVVLLLGSFVVFPQMDLWVSGLFALAGKGFPLHAFWPLVALNVIAFDGARILAGLFCGGLFVSLLLRRTFLSLSPRKWLFLRLALLVGPGLVANVVFKDHWGRARPREIVAFGGKASFSPPLLISDQCKSNCSFVSGDGAFGFFLPAFAYVVPDRRKKAAFRGLLGLGALFGGARILMGAHFLSDVLFAAFFMTLVSALLHLLLFGREKTLSCWRRWLSLQDS